MGLNCSLPIERKQTDNCEGNNTTCVSCLGGCERFPSKASSDKHSVTTTANTTTTTTQWQGRQSRDATALRNNAHSPTETVSVYTPQQVLEAAQRVVLKHFACIPSWAGQPPAAAVCCGAVDKPMSSPSNIEGGGTEDGGMCATMMIRHRSQHSQCSVSSGFTGSAMQHLEPVQGVHYTPVQGDAGSDVGHRDTGYQTPAMLQNSGSIHKHTHHQQQPATLDPAGPADYDDEHQTQQQAIMLCGVDPVVVASLCLIHSQGRQRVSQTSGPGRASVVSSTPPAHTHQGLSQLSVGIVEWLSCEAGYDVFGAPPSAQQMEQLDCGVYFCAALFQTLEIHCSRLQRGIELPGPKHASGQAILRTLRQLVLLTADTSHASPFTRISSLPLAPASTPCLYPRPAFISARWGPASAGVYPVEERSTRGGSQEEDQGMSNTPLTSVAALVASLPPAEVHAQLLHALVGTYHVAADKDLCKQVVAHVEHHHQMMDTTVLAGICTASWSKFSPAHALLIRLATALAIRATAGPAPATARKHPSPPGADSDSDSDVDHDAPVVMYICGTGDTIASVAAAVDLSEEQLLDANPGLGADPSLRPFDCLALPVASILPRLYCMQPQDTLLSVANQLGVTLHRLISYNTSASFNPRAPQAGWLLEVPGLYGHM